MSGLKFIGCCENHVVSVSQFQLENSGFFGNGQALVNGRVLIIEESVASLDRVTFIPAVEKLQNTASIKELENCTVCDIEIVDVAAIGVFLKSSNIKITQSRFEGNQVGLGAVIYDEFGSDIIINGSIFTNNSAAQYCNSDCCIFGGIVHISKQHRSTVKFYYSKFEQNVGVAILSQGDNTIYTGTVNIIHSKFVDNTVLGPRIFLDGEFKSNSLINIDRVMITINVSKFINNRVSFALVNILYYTTVEHLTNNVFMENNAAYEVFVRAACRPGLGLSLGSSRCIQCSKNWHRDLLGIVIAAFIAGIALVIFMLALNVTVAVGTLNGILFYAHIVAANADTYFLPFKTPDFITVFISWLNLDIGFDICFSAKYELIISLLSKSLIQLAFPVYVILLVIIVIVTSNHSSKFTDIIGKGNPVAVLATMLLLSVEKLLNVILASFSLLYLQPAYGSRNIDVTRLQNVLTGIEESKNTKFKAVTYFYLIVSLLLLLMCLIYTALVFSWQ